MEMNISARKMCNKYFLIRARCTATLASFAAVRADDLTLMDSFDDELMDTFTEKLIFEMK